MTSSSASVDPQVWGPSVWASMHVLARKADADNHSVSFHAFVKSLQSLIPCEKCRIDYDTWVKTNGLPEDTKAFEWTVRLHNFVNQKLGKPEIAFHEAEALWSSGKCSYQCNDTPPQLRDAPSQKLSLLSSTSSYYIVQYIVLLVCILMLVRLWYNK